MTRAHILAVPFHIEQGVVGEGNDRPLLVVSGVEIERIGRQVFQLDPVDIKVAGGDPLLPLIGHGQTGIFMEGHFPVAVESPAVGGDLDGKCLDVGPHPVAGGEKIPEGRFHGGDVGIVPVDPKNQGAGIASLESADGEPDMLDLPRSFQVREHHRLSGLDAEGIGVGFRIEQSARIPHPAPGLFPGDVTELAIGKNRDDLEAQKKNQDRHRPSEETLVILSTSSPPGKESNGNFFRSRGSRSSIIRFKEILSFNT